MTLPSLTILNSAILSNRFYLKICLVDFDDSYTLNLADYLRQSGSEVQVLDHQETNVSSLKACNYNAIVLSPGPGNPSDIPLIHQIVEYHQSEIPILGICLGHQGIGLHYGHLVKRSKHPIHGIPVKIIWDQDLIFENIKAPFYAMRYNSLTVNESNSSPLKIICRDEYNDIMGFRHLTFPIYSFQFHPESIGTPQGMLLLQNWLQYVRNYK